MKGKEIFWIADDGSRHITEEKCKLADRAIECEGIAIDCGIEIPKPIESAGADGESIGIDDSNIKAFLKALVTFGEAYKKAFSRKRKKGVKGDRNATPSKKNKTPGP